MRYVITIIVRLVGYMNIHPIRLTGIWDEGYALDVHTISRTYIGKNAYGYPEYQKEYSEMGGLVYQFKYRNNYSVLSEIITLVTPFINSWGEMKDVDFVIPVPPSKERTYQPAQEIAREIADSLNASYTNNILVKRNNVESKNLSREEKKLIKNSIMKIKTATKPHNILLVDDLYSSGTTLTECVTALRDDSNIRKIYVLTMTKTGG